LGDPLAVLLAVGGVAVAVAVVARNRSTLSATASGNYEQMSTAYQPT
jgi:hypothetical protein